MSLLHQALGANKTLYNGVRFVVLYESTSETVRFLNNEKVLFRLKCLSQKHLYVNAYIISINGESPINIFRENYKVLELSQKGYQSAKFVSEIRKTCWNMKIVPFLFPNCWPITHRLDGKILTFNIPTSFSSFFFSCSSKFFSNMALSMVSLYSLSCFWWADTASS